MNELLIFTNYYSKFDSSVDAISSKYDHTFRVINYAKDIAESLNLSESDINTAKICALFHDMGRFGQYEKYQTFIDAISVDHGDYGYEILKNANYNNETVLNAVKYHNKYSIPSNLSKRDQMFCKITRDADKIDIMNMQGNTCDAKNFELPDFVYNAFVNHKLITNTDTDTNSKLIDIFRLLAFIFDMNYRRSFELVEAYDIINKKCNMLYDKYHDERINDIRNICNKYVKSKINSQENYE